VAGAPHDVERVDRQTAVVTVGAGAGMTSGQQVFELLTELKAAGVHRLVVDLRTPQMLNSKVLDALVRAAADLDPRDGAGLAVITDQQYVRTILEITANGGLLFLAESREEALDALPPRSG
jgi:anti-anti-sigma regulatory factor